MSKVALLSKGIYACVLWAVNNRAPLIEVNQVAKDCFTFAQECFSFRSFERDRLECFMAFLGVKDIPKE